MAVVGRERGRGGFRGRNGSSHSENESSAGTSRGGQETCVCEANAPLLCELRNLDGECLRTGKQNRRHGVKRAIKSLKLYPLPITTEAEACALEGVGSLTARRMLRGLKASLPSHEPRGGSSHHATPRGLDSNTCHEENIEPQTVPRGTGAERGREKRINEKRTRPAASRLPGGELSSNAGAWNSTLLRTNINGSNDRNNRVSPHQRFSLAANLFALRGEDVNTAARNADGTPRRPTSRARREPGVSRIGADMEMGVGNAASSEAPALFVGQWEAWLIVDNREHECLSVQSALLQQGVPCETRQLPLGDMLWVARRPDDPASEVLLGFIVERKTASDLASSIVDGRYDEQKRRLQRSGLRRCIYLVEGNLSHQKQMAPETLRSALTTSQACGGLAVIRCASLRDTVDFLARTHRHIASLLYGACSATTSVSWPENNASVDGPASVSSRLHGSVLDHDCAPLRPAMTYGEYAQGCAKRANITTARQVLGAMVRQAPGCSAVRAEAIVRAFQSPLGLILALERTAGVGDGDAERFRKVDELLSGLRCSDGAGTNKLPQPLRRLLCRLFLGESAAGRVVDGYERCSSVLGDPTESEEPLDWSVEPMRQDDAF